MPHAVAEENEIEDRRLAYRRVITLVLVVAAAVTVAVKGSGNATTTVLAVVAGTIWLIAWKTSDMPKLHKTYLPAAIALEFLLDMWAASTPQIITTACVAAAVLWDKIPIGHLPCHRRNKASDEDEDEDSTDKDLYNPIYVGTPVHVLLWVTFRTVVITLSTGSATRRSWMLSQLFLLVALTIHIIARLKPGTSGAKSIAIAGTLVVVFILYSVNDVVPRGISTIVVMVPVVYLICAAVPAEPNHTKLKFPEIATFVIVATCIAVSMGWENTAAGDNLGICSSTAFNTRKCRYTFDVPAGHSGCCCDTGFIPVRFTRGCAPDSCRSVLQHGEPTDCCRNPLSSSTVAALVAGPDLCLCSNTREEPGLNAVIFIDGVASCSCRNGLTGTYCETTKPDL